MTDEDVIRMAREAGAGVCDYGDWLFSDSELARFAALVAASEREECARVCQEGVQNAEEWDSSYWDQACENRAIAIRNRQTLGGNQ